MGKVKAEPIWLRAAVVGALVFVGHRLVAVLPPDVAAAVDVPALVDASGLAELAIYGALIALAWLGRRGVYSPATHDRLVDSFVKRAMRTGEQSGREAALAEVADREAAARRLGEQTGREAGYAEGRTAGIAEAQQEAAGQL